MFKKERLDPLKVSKLRHQWTNTHTHTHTHTDTHTHTHTH